MAGPDPSEGFEGVAAAYSAARSEVGAAEVLGWAQGALAPGARILDAGCGDGRPLAVALRGAGFDVWGIDPSRALLARFRAACPGAPAACETIQDGAFFGARFDAVLAVGVLFLLPEADQRRALPRLARALRPGGRLLFTAPAAPCAWRDSLTGRTSRSLGADAYRAILSEAGLDPEPGFEDAGANAYHAARRPER